MRAAGVRAAGVRAAFGQTAECHKRVTIACSKIEKPTPQRETTPLTVCVRETCSRSENGAYCKRGLQHTATARNVSADKKSKRRQEFSLSNQTSAKLISLVSRHQVRVVDQLFSLISTPLSSLIPIITAFLPPKVNSLSHLEYILCAETR